MELKPTYEELKERVAELGKEAADCKSAEESLRRSNEIVNSILSASPIGIGLVENRIIKRINILERALESFIHRSKISKGLATLFITI